MVVERIPIKFNKYVFDNFYSEKKTWPYIFIYSFVTRKKLLQVNRNCQIYYPDIKVDCYTAIEVESDVRLTYFEEDMFMAVPEYFLELFEDLEPIMIEGLSKCYCSI